MEEKVEEDYSSKSSTISKCVKMSKSQGVKRKMGSNFLRCQGTWGQSVYLGTWSIQEERTIRACLLKKVHLV